MTVTPGGRADSPATTTGAVKTGGSAAPAGPFRIIDAGLRAAPAAVALLRGPEFVLEFANPTFFAVIGGRPGLGRPIAAVLPELAGQGYLELLEEVFRTGQPYAARQSPVLLDRAPGGLQQTYFNFSYEPTRDPTGVVDGVAIVAVEVTDLVYARHELAESLGQLEAVFRGAPIGLALVSPDLRIVRANDAFWTAGERAAGEQAAARLPAGVADVVPASATVEQLLRAVLHSGAAVLDRNVEIAPTAGRARRFWQLGCYPVHAENEVIGAGLVLLDLTEQQRFERLLRGQRHVLELIARAAPLGVVLDALVRLVEWLSTEQVVASILLLDDDGVHLRHGAAPGLPAAYNAAVDGLAIGPLVGSCGTAAHQAARVIVSDIARDERWADFRDLARAHDLAACWSTPIMSGTGGVLGTFAMYYHQPHRPDDADLALVDVFAGTAAVAIERCHSDTAREQALAREHATRLDAERAQADLRFVLEASTAIADSFDYPASIERLARLAVPTLADLCLIDILDKGVVRRVAAVHADPSRAELVGRLRAYPPDLNGPHPVARVLAGGQPEIAAEADPAVLHRASAAAEHRRVIAALGFRSYLCVPLTARGTTFGVFTLVATESGRRFESRDLALAEELAGRAALAIDNARLFARRRQVASELQRGLLPPRLPRVPGVRLAARYQPAGEGLEVGGDFYDVFPLPDGDWAFMIGDVSGTGPTAAGITSLVRHTARAVANCGRDPANVVDAVNQALRDQIADETFVTLLYGTLRPGPNGAEVGIVSAGHPLPLLRRRGGRVEPVGAPGLLLGQLPVTRVRPTGVHLEATETLLCYTDGVIEAHARTRRSAAPDLFGVDRLTRVLAAAPSADPNALAAGVEQAVLDFTNGDAGDDVAILALQPAPATETAPTAAGATATAGAARPG